MSCTPISLSGIGLDCSSIAGLKEVYIADVQDVDIITLSSDTIVSGITMETGKKFKVFNFKRGNANFVSTGNRNDQNGTYYVENVLTVTFNKQETAKRTDLAQIAKGNVHVIVKDWNDIYWLLTYDTYAYGNVTANSGAALGDANNYQLVLTSQTASLPLEVPSDAITSIVA